MQELMTFRAKVRRITTKENKKIEVMLTDDTRERYLSVDVLEPHPFKIGDEVAVTISSAKP